MFSSLLLAVFGLCVNVVAEEVAFFKSRPDLYPPRLDITINEPDRLSPGYIFITPYQGQNPAPHIYDNNGELIWSGWGGSGPGNAHGLHVCRYKGADHLCFFQGHQEHGYCRGHGIIMDNQYRIVRSVQPGGGMAASDMHEFILTNNGKTALMTIYQQRQFDLAAWNVKTGLGWVMESIFQEVDVETSKVLFEWRSLDHVDPSMSYTYPDHTDTGGTGLNVHQPWDYFHINSIDKNDDGDYLISSRHTCAIYKISGKDGSVMWQLNGANPTFQNINFVFSQQHDARWLFENATHTLLSLYNNGDNGFNQTNTYSSGMVILINHVDNTALQIREYTSALKDIISTSQGNTQVLPNRNVMIGWGNNPWLSEHDENGNLLFWGIFGGEPIMNYRVMKFEWEGNPTDSPALWSYSRTADPHSLTNFYVSWNGATRVHRWRFYGATNITGPYVFLSEIYKTGFETAYINATFYPWTRAEAVDRNGAVLGKTRNKFTFVPSPELREFCADDSCGDAPWYGVPGEVGARPLIPPAGVNTVPWVQPDHPGSPIWTYPSGYRESPSRLPSDIGEILGSWAIVLVILVPFLVGIFCARRYYMNRPRYAHPRDQEASESLTGMGEQKPPPTRAADFPWWHWRWWSGDDDDTQYVPLAERSPRQRQRLD
ncbi:hypothetical protein NUU61_006306 [Penicillium alfredii]|uniref:ASST-domain-containing protein n=1 Tax=Penicillium alfredii TaxID=1506179 RepID=A0A9W9F0U2_9EURO|nr:uncharacterized protein NUU61_006306 [Penicillium alfredii]KAJ5091436.1 hypothetical protein NUU61_006306 [Penicillium alfredii]